LAAPRMAIPEDVFMPDTAVVAVLEVKVLGFRLLGITAAACTYRAVALVLSAIR